MNTLKRDAMFYLAAAVSDFYVPWEAMVRTVDLPFENIGYYLPIISQINNFVAVP